MIHQTLQGPQESLRTKLPEQLSLFPPEKFSIKEQWASRKDLPWRNNSEFLGFKIICLILFCTFCFISLEQKEIPHNGNKKYRSHKRRHTVIRSESREHDLVWCFLDLCRSPMFIIYQKKAEWNNENIYLKTKGQDVITNIYMYVIWLMHIWFFNIVLGLQNIPK